MTSKTISEFPGLYRLDPVQSAIQCNRGLMTSATGMLCTAKPIKTQELADVESELFGINPAKPGEAPALPVPLHPGEFQVEASQAEFLHPQIKYRGPTRGVQYDRFIHSYPMIPRVSPETLQSNRNTRQIYKF